MIISPSARRLLRGRLAIPLVAAALVVGALPAPVAAVGGIVFDGSPGTNPPPATLGGFPMTPFGADGYGAFQLIGTVPAPGGGTVGFSPSVYTYDATALFGYWTAGYTGHVYFNDSVPAITMTLPAGTQAFYFYGEPNACGAWNVTATTDNGTTTGPVYISGVCGGAPSPHYFGFYSTGAATISSITLSTDAPAYGVIVGQFGINAGAAPAPKPSDPPKVTALNPGAGKVGSTVTIMGTSFSYANRVTFNGVATSFSVRSPTTIVATVPAGATTGPVRVTTPFGSSQSARSFYVLP
jgi:hypothetical protein